MFFTSQRISSSLISSLKIISISFLFFGCSSVQRFGKSDSQSEKEIINKNDKNEIGKNYGSDIRLLINQPSDQITFKTGEDINLINDKNEIMHLDRGETIEFSSEGGVILSNNSSSSHYVIKTDDSFSFNNKKFTGDILVKTDGEKLYIINSLPIEEYLKGVVPSEMPVGTGNEYYEALKAFSICARTYAIKRMMDSKSLFDVRTDVSDQVYGGLGRKKAISDHAVDETMGTILAFNNLPAVVFYSSTCGGITEDVENVFGKESLPYLKSIQDGEIPYCSVSPRFTWEENFTGERIVTLLKRSKKILYSDYDLEDIKVNSRFESGRIKELEIILENSSEGRISIKLFGNNIRFVLLSASNQTLNSNNFEIIKQGDNFKFRGKGWGHGVGLCQWGAMAQSSKGITYNKILEHYFPGTELMRYYGEN